MADQDKMCESCGRRTSHDARYCSTDCERRGVTEVDRALEAEILDLLAQRDAGKTICVSEAARAAYRDTEQSAGDEGWRDLMEPARRAARRLVVTGDVVITQGGKVVDPSTAKGPIRVRRSG